MSEQTQQPPAPATPDEKQQAPEHHYHHEAEKTELEKWLTAGLKKIEPYSNQILMGFIGITVLLIAVILWSKSAGSAQTEEWQKFVENRVPDDYMNLAKQNPDSEVGAWSLLQAGRLYLQEGLQTALTNRETSDARLESAVEAFEKLLKQSDAPASAREDALFGLATAREVLNGDDPSQAITAYQKLIDEFQDSGYTAWATQRVEALQQDSNQEFYAWFRKQNPKPSDRALPSDLSQGGAIPPPPTNLDLLDDSSLKLPASGVGEANTNTVPSDEEMKKDGEEPAKTDGTAPKAFPIPEKSDTEKSDTKKDNTETGDAKEASEKPAQGDEKPSETAKPAPEEPKAEEAKPESPKAELPQADAPKPEEPKTSEPKPAATPEPSPEESSEE